MAGGRTAARFVAGLVLLSLAAAACSSEAEPHSRPSPVTPGAMPSSAIAPQPVSSSTGPLDTKNSVPAGTHIADKRRITADQGHKVTAYLLDIDSGGTALMDVGPQDEGDNPVPVLLQHRIELWSPTGQKTVVADGRTTRRGAVAQTFAANLCGGVPVWADTHSTDVIDLDWRVWSLPKGSVKPTLLGDSKQFAFGKQTASPPEPFTITTNQSTAYWTASRHVKKLKRNSGWQAVIVSRPLDGSKKLAVVAQDAKMPVALGKRLLYITDPGLSGRGAKDHFQIRELSKGKDRIVRDQRIPHRAQIGGFAASDQLTVTTVIDPIGKDDEDPETATMTIWRKGQPQPTIVHLRGDGASGIHISGDLVAWGNGSGNGDPGMYVLDLATRTIYKVSKLLGGSRLTMCGPNLAWSVQGKTPVFDTATAIWR